MKSDLGSGVTLLPDTTQILLRNVEGFSLYFLSLFLATSDPERGPDESTVHGRQEARSAGPGKPSAPVSHNKACRGSTQPFQIELRG